MNFTACCLLLALLAAVRASDLMEAMASRSGMRRSEDGPEGAMYAAAQWGAQRIGGGEAAWKQKQAKTDSGLPKYCDPPNPCPKSLVERLEPGYDINEVASRYGCNPRVPDSEDFNRRWIAEAQTRGECACDREHMRSCPRNRPTIASGEGAPVAPPPQQERYAVDRAEQEEDGPAPGAPDLNLDSDEDLEDLNLGDTVPQVSAKKRPALEDNELDGLAVDELEREQDRP